MFTYFNNIAINPSLVEECLNLPNEMEETRPEIKDSKYREFFPIQVGFFKKKTENICPGLFDNNCKFQLIHQKPGRMLPWHIDEFNNIPSKTYLIFLTDWKPGQVFGTENDTYVDWKSGDCITWDYKVWHFTSNASLFPKLTCQVIKPTF